jgi:hypothetical protein
MCGIHAEQRVGLGTVPWITASSLINPVHNSKSYLLQIQFNIILRLYFLNDLILYGFPNKILYNRIIISMHTA